MERELRRARLAGAGGITALRSAPRRAGAASALQRMHAREGLRIEATGLPDRAVAARRRGHDRAARQPARQRVQVGGLDGAAARRRGRRAADPRRRRRPRRGRPGRGDRAGARRPPGRDPRRSRSRARHRAGHRHALRRSARAEPVRRTLAGCRSRFTCRSGPAPLEAGIRAPRPGAMPRSPGRCRGRHHARGRTTPRPCSTSMPRPSRVLAAACARPQQTKAVGSARTSCRRPRHRRRGNRRDRGQPRFAGPPPCRDHQVESSPGELRQAAASTVRSRSRSPASSTAFAAVRLPITKAAGRSASSGRSTPREAPPAPSSSTRAPASMNR